MVLNCSLAVEPDISNLQVREGVPSTSTDGLQPEKVNGKADVKCETSDSAFAAIAMVHGGLISCASEDMMAVNSGIQSVGTKSHDIPDSRSAASESCATVNTYWWCSQVLLDPRGQYTSDS